MLRDQELLQVMEDWSFWSKEPSPGVARELAPQCKPLPSLVTVIQGVRRCGKSTLLRQLLIEHNIPRKSAVFVNFEDPRLMNHLDHTLLEAIKKVAEFTLSGPVTFFLDEIQNVQNWENWLHTQLEFNHGHRFVITGSNSRLLSGELATALTGRHITYELFPFNHHEFQVAYKRKSIELYLKHGGFPGVVKFPEPEKLLQQYFHDIIERDVRERVAAKSSQPLKALAQMVLESAGAELSLRRLAGALGMSTSTVQVYLQACEDAYLILSCPYFAYSEAKRQRRNKKYYSIDTALRRAVSTKLGADLGKDFENLVYLTLRQKTKEVYYWKDKGEVDFVINTSNGVTPLQVTVGEPQERHDKALQSFYEIFPHANEAILVTPKNCHELVGLDF